MDRAEALKKLNTIYIISKGRPQCRTAVTLEKCSYPGEWFIVCGTNDDTLGQYKERWGDHVLVFDWHEEVKHTETMDNFGFDSMASGAVPVRNATMHISHDRGELRHWQLDDDYVSFYRTSHDFKRKLRLSGDELQDVLLDLAIVGYEANFSNIGICQATIEAHPMKAKTVTHRVFNVHNLPSDFELFTRWRGRMNDDLINAMDVWRTGGYELSFKHACVVMTQTQQEEGGLTDLYRQEGTVRKTAYAVLACPGAVELVCKFGRWHHKVNWARLVPKIIRANQ